MSDSTCTICLDTLLSKDGGAIGAATSCGHCFHVECFDPWFARGSGRCKCPNCNVLVKEFVKVFISQNDDADGDLGDDDMSLSSTETQEEDDDDDEDEGEGSKDDDEDEDNNDNPTDEKAAEEEQGDSNTDSTSSNSSSTGPAGGGNHEQTETEMDPPSINRVVDLTLSPERPATRQTPPRNNIAADDVQRTRLSKIAKRYKRRYKQKESQFREHFAVQKQLREKLSAAKEEFKTSEEALDAVEGELESLQLELDEKRVFVVRSTNENACLQSQLQDMKRTAKEAQANFQILESSYKQDLDRARLKSMAEVQQLLEQYPKLVEENRVLKQEVLKYQRQSKSTSSNNKSKPKSSDRDLLKGLRLMDEARIRAQPKEQQQQQQPPRNKETTNHCSTKYGAQANRLALAMHKQRKKPAPMIDRTNVSEDALLQRDHSRVARAHTSTAPLARSHSLGSRSASTSLRSDETARGTSSDLPGLKRQNSTAGRSSHRPSPLATSLNLAHKKRKGTQGSFGSRFTSVPDF